MADGGGISVDRAERMNESESASLNTGVTSEEVEVPNEYRVVCSDCGADGGTYSLSVPHDAPDYCPWCGHAVNGETTSVVRGDSETTGLSDGGNL